MNVIGIQDDRALGGCAEFKMVLSVQTITTPATVSRRTLTACGSSPRGYSEVCEIQILRAAASPRLIEVLRNSRVRVPS